MKRLIVSFVVIVSICGTTASLIYAQTVRRGFEPFYHVRPTRELLTKIGAAEVGTMVGQVMVQECGDDPVCKNALWRFLDKYSAAWFEDTVNRTPTDCPR